MKTPEQILRDLLTPFLEEAFADSPLGSGGGVVVQSSQIQFGESGNVEAIVPLPFVPLALAEHMGGIDFSVATNRSVSDSAITRTPLRTNREWRTL